MKTLKLNNTIDLLNACKSGNAKAQMQLYNQYALAMYKVSRNIVNDDMKAEDVMQEAFLSAFKNLHTFNGNVTFGAWLKRIVVNKSLDYLKKDKIFNLNEGIGNFSIVEDINDDDYLNSNKVESIKKAMDNLPKKYKIILSLYYLEGYDHEEISDILEISYNNARTTLSRAKNKLKTLLN